ncbi:MAG: hypothetical protein IPO21_13170 [Bacteroidales bacterium]|nr:hypothetical protein [Bacteroidales bacterium]
MFKRILILFLFVFCVSSSLFPQLIIDDCTDGDDLTALGTRWYSYTDTADGGLSKIVAPTNIFKMSNDGSGNNAAAIVYELEQGNCSWCPYVGMGLWLPNAKDSTGGRVVLVDNSYGASSGISFRYKGNGGVIELITSSVTDYNYHFVQIPASETWSKITLSWQEFHQQNIVGSPNENLNPAKIGKLQFAVKQAYNGTNVTGSLWIDDVILYIETIEVNKDLLNAAISKANNYLDSARNQLTTDIYPTLAVDILKKALEVPEKIAQSNVANQKEIDNATTLLESKIQNFKKSIVKTENSVLILVADCEKGNKTELNSYWFSYNDAMVGGKSVVVPFSDPNTAFSMSAGGINGVDSAAYIAYTLNQNSQTYLPHVGMGVCIYRACRNL